MRLVFVFRMIGQGAFGEVYEGTLRNLCANVSELPVAVKVALNKSVYIYIVHV